MFDSCLFQVHQVAFGLEVILCCGACCCGVCTLCGLSVAHWQSAIDMLPWLALLYGAARPGGKLPACTGWDLCTHPHGLQRSAFGEALDGGGAGMSWWAGLSLVSLGCATLLS